MSGRKSRNKGRRGEQQLVLHLAKLGFKAERILRQYQFAEQPDVLAERNGVTLTFELKLRKESYKTLYAFYHQEKDPTTQLALFSIGEEAHCVALSTDVEALLNRDNWFFPTVIPDEDNQRKRICNRFIKMKELKQAADLLVIRDDRQPFLFIRYW